MKHKLKTGSIFTSLIVFILLASALIGLIAFIMVKFNLLPKNKIIETGISSDKFQKETLMRAVSFKDSRGVDKKFVIVKESEEGGIPIADAYITDSNLSKITATKVAAFASDSSLGYAASTMPIGGTGLAVSVSPQNGKKFIAVSESVGDATTITILDETGELVSDKSVNNIIDIIGEKCRCGFFFESWKNNSTFSVRVSTASGETLEATIDATSGRVLGNLKKI